MTISLGYSSTYVQAIEKPGDCYGLAREGVRGEGVGQKWGYGILPTVTYGQPIWDPSWSPKSKLSPTLEYPLESLGKTNPHFSFKKRGHYS
jgi:hypothetical protein